MNLNRIKKREVCRALGPIQKHLREKSVRESYVIKSKERSN